VDPSLLKTRKQKTELEVGAGPATMRKSPTEAQGQKARSAADGEGYCISGGGGKASTFVRKGKETGQTIQYVPCQEL